MTISPKSAGRSRRSGRLAGAAFGAIILMTGLAGVAAAPASAAGASLSRVDSVWSIEPTPNHLVSTGALSSDSCPTPTMCMAVGSDADGSLAKLRDGTRWSDLGTPVPVGASANALAGVSCPSTTSCTAVGSYTDSSGAELTLAEVWNGSAWTIQTTPNPDGATAASLASVSCPTLNVCTAVGSYTDTSGAILTLAEEWTGTAWAIQVTPDPAGSTDSTLSNVSCSSATACLAIGSDSDSDGANATLAEVWDGGTWSIHDLPSTSAQLDAVSCTSATYCTAVGSRETKIHIPEPVAAVWNGTAWTQRHIPSPPPSLLAKLTSVSCPSAISCTAVGFYGDMAQDFAGFTETWNGTVWTMRTLFNANLGQVTLYGVSCPSALDCRAVGSAFVNPFVEVPLAEMGTGTVWRVQKVHLPKGVGNNSLAAVSCPSATACTAVGFRFKSSARYLTLVEAWNGTTWTFQNTPNPRGATYSALDAVACVSAADCTAVGYYYANGAQNPTAFAEGWNGKTWTIQATPNPSGADNSSLTGVSCSSATTCMAVGDYVNGSGNFVSLAETWDGAVWTVQSTPNPTGATVSFLTGVSCGAPSNCVAVGAYAKSSGKRVGLAEVWDGTAWTIKTVPSPSGARGSSLGGVSCPSVTVCTAVGSYTKSSGKSATLAERWNGTSWVQQSIPNPTGPGSNGLVGVSCQSASACSAVGFTGSDVLAEGWTDSGWTVQATANPTGAIISALAGVSCPSSTACTAVGSATNGSLINQTLAEADGT